MIGDKLKATLSKREEARQAALPCQDEVTQTALQMSHAAVVATANDYERRTLEARKHERAGIMNAKTPQDATKIMAELADLEQLNTMWANALKEKGMVKQKDQRAYNPHQREFNSINDYEQWREYYSQTARTFLLDLPGFPYRGNRRYFSTYAVSSPRRQLQYIDHTDLMPFPMLRIMELTDIRDVETYTGDLEYTIVSYAYVS